MNYESLKLFSDCASFLPRPVCRIDSSNNSKRRAKVRKKILPFPAKTAIIINFYLFINIYWPKLYISLINIHVYYD